MAVLGAIPKLKLTGANPTAMGMSPVTPGFVPGKFTPPVGKGIDMKSTMKSAAFDVGAKMAQKEAKFTGVKAPKGRSAAGVRGTPGRLVQAKERAGKALDEMNAMPLEAQLSAALPKSAPLKKMSAYNVGVEMAQKEMEKISRMRGFSQLVKQAPKAVPPRPAGPIRVPREEMVRSVGAKQDANDLLAFKQKMQSSGQHYGSPVVQEQSAALAQQRGPVAAAASPQPKAPAKRRTASTNAPAGKAPVQRPQAAPAPQAQPAQAGSGMKFRAANQDEVMAQRPSLRNTPTNPLRDSPMRPGMMQRMNDFGSRALQGAQNRWGQMTPGQQIGAGAGAAGVAGLGGGYMLGNDDPTYSAGPFSYNGPSLSSLFR